MKNITWYNYTLNGAAHEANSIDSVTWDGLKLVIILKRGNSLEKSEKISVTFVRSSPFSPFAYRLTNESQRQETWNSSINPSPVSAIRFTQESEFIDWLKNEDGEITDFSKIKHYLIGNDDVLEVLSQEDPVIGIA